MRLRAAGHRGVDASEERRREVLERLEAAGRVGDSTPWAEGTTHDGMAPGLRRALSELGAVFSSFGLYLSTRADVLTASDCLELAAIADRGPELSLAAVIDLLAGELGDDPSVLFGKIEPRPAASQLLCQSHRALTPAGEPVVITFLRPGFDRELAIDLELLPIVARRLAASGVPASAADLVADFRRNLLADLDLGARAAALEDLADEAVGDELMWTPRVYRHLSTASVLTREDLGGRRIAHLEGPANGPSPASGERRDLVRRLALVWLCQALHGRALAADPRAENVEVLPDGRIAFVGGPFLALPAAVQEDILAYLAAAGAEPGEACANLLRLTHRDAGAVEVDELLLRARQAVPFRDGSWSSSGESLAEHLFVQWRLARISGYRLRSPALAFCRGLVTVAAIARRLTPGYDVLQEAQEEIRRERDAGKLREAFSPRGLVDSLEPHAELLLALPQKLDAVLSLLARGDARVRLELHQPAKAGRRRDSLTAVLAGAVAIAAVAVLLARFAGALAPAPWVERAGALLIVACGALILRQVSREP